MSPALPDGPRGRVLALGMTGILAALVWFSAVSPLLSLYRDRDDLVTRQHALLLRMQALAEALPSLEREAAAASAAGPARSALVEGASDAVAGATLQETVQTLAGQAGASLTSAEALPTEAAGAYRRVGVRVSLSASWPVLVKLFEAVELATPRMLIDDIQLQAPPVLLRAQSLPLEASFTVLAFRSATTEPPPPQTDAGPLGGGTAAPP